VSERPRPSYLAEGTSAGLLFLASPVAGYFLGRWIGTLLGLGRVPAWVGAALGLAGAFLHLFRVVARMR
jgi:hypothetical protein